MCARERVFVQEDQRCAHCSVRENIRQSTLTRDIWMSLTPKDDLRCALILVAIEHLHTKNETFLSKARSSIVDLIQEQTSHRDSFENVAICMCRTFFERQSEVQIAQLAACRPKFYNITFRTRRARSQRKLRENAGNT